LARFFSKGNSYLNTKEEEGPVPLDHLGSETGLLTGHTHTYRLVSLAASFFPRKKKKNSLQLLPLDTRARLLLLLPSVMEVNF
jgi:hypothetical protein